ncbi:MAG TPA: 3'(2'),5'-bisphosphate nucleotidase [Kiritimatiellia bacterium]|nr:3'(2'),5'-bisphosphate nucleotidase [Kiritimatiellia bacterium]HMP34889.1 3'(2'),5'-bisphosphate nucleotidase [Kiritimatiellia bacterium]
MYEAELQTALSAVRKAIALAEHVAAGLTADGAMTKADASPVTVADYGVQAIIHRALAAAYPGDPIVAEEDADDLTNPGNRVLAAMLMRALEEASSGWTAASVVEHIGRGRHAGGAEGRFWTLDPIDGTKGFLRGDQYAIALALIEQGRPVLGVLGCPRLRLSVLDGGAATGWICHATASGAFAQPIAGGDVHALRTSPVHRTDDLVMCESVESGHSAHDVSALIAGALGLHRAPVRMDSQAKYAAVAAGEADVYLRLPTKSSYREKIWDHAAGAVLVEQAGGTVRDVRGVPLDFSRGRTLADNRGVIASASAVHASIVNVVAPHFPG